MHIYQSFMEMSAVSATYCHGQVLHQNCLPISSLHCISHYYKLLQLWMWLVEKMQRNQIPVRNSECCIHLNVIAHNYMTAAFH